MISKHPLELSIPFILLAMAVISISGQVSAERVIDTDTSWSVVEIVLNESVRVVSGGRLVIESSNVSFNCTTPLEYGLKVESGGALVLTDGDGASDTEWDRSRLTGIRPFFLIVSAGASLTLRNSMITNCGRSSDPFQSGIEVYTSNCRVEGMIFKDSYCGLGVYGCHDFVISGSTFVGLDTGIDAVDSEGISLVNCTFAQSSMGAWFYSCAGMLFEGCDFTQLRSSAIRAESSPGITVGACTFTGCRTYGVYLEGSNGQQSSRGVTAGTLLTSSSFDGTAYPIVLDNMRNVSIENSSFTMFTSALNLWMAFATQITFEGNDLGFGETGVDCAVSTCMDLSINNNTFTNLTTAMNPKGSRVRIEHNRIIGMRSSGIHHTSDGLVFVSGNTFVDCTYGIRIERDLLFDPGMILEANTFVDDKYGILARDVRSLTLSGDTWTRGDTALTLLGLDASGITQENISGFKTGLSLMGARGTASDLHIADCDIGISSDLATSMTFIQCDLTQCPLKAVAGNGSKLVLRDSMGTDSLLVLDGTSEIWVEWTSSILLLYASTDLPAPGVPVELIPTGMPSLGHYVTDSKGSVGPLAVPTSRAALDGVRPYNPYEVDVTYERFAHSLAVRFETIHLFTFYIDDVPPTIEVSEPADNSAMNRTSIECKVTVDDLGGEISSAILLIDGRAAIDVMHYIGGVPFRTDLAQGSQDLTFIAEDTWHNSHNVTIHVTIDVDPPVIVISEPADGTLTNRSSITISGTVLGHSIATVGGVPLITGANGDFSVVVELTDEGSNAIRIWASDAVGNAQIETVNVIRDMLPPNITLEKVPKLTNAANIEVRGTSDGDRIVCTNSEETVLGAGSFTFLIPLAEGSNSLCFEAWDLAGNIALAQVRCFSDRHLDFEIVEPVDGATVDQSWVEINTTGELGLTIRLTGQTTLFVLNRTSASNISLRVGPLKSGINQFLFNVSDTAGNSASITYVLNLPEPTRRTPHIGPFWYIIVLAMVILVFVSMAIMMRWRFRAR
jgi:hypothetical protein